MILLLRYLPYLIGVGAVLAAYIYWYDHTYSEGYDDAVVLYEKRDAATLVKAQALMVKRTEENAVLLEEQQNRYMGAIEVYAKHIEDINAAAIRNAGKRLYVHTKPNTTCSTTLPSGAGDTSGIGAGGREFHSAELAGEVVTTLQSNAREVAVGFATCQRLLDIVTH